MSISAELNEYIVKERTFLHDISNQLVIAQGMGSFVLGTVKKRTEEANDLESKELIRMEKTIKAINKMIDMVKERREVVKGVQAI